MDELIEHAVRKELEGLDGLVLVHPDYPQHFDKGLLERLNTATLYFLEKDLPVVAIPYTSETGVKERFGALTDSWNCLSDEEYFVPEELLSLIDLFAAGTDRTIEDCTVGFGGIYCRRCVASLAKRCASAYEGPEPEYLEGTSLLKPAARARVLENVSLDL